MGDLLMQLANEFCALRKMKPVKSQFCYQWSGDVHAVCSAVLDHINAALSSPHDKSMFSNHVVYNLPNFMHDMGVGADFVKSQFDRCNFMTVPGRMALERTILIFQGNIASTAESKSLVALGRCLDLYYGWLDNDLPQAQHFSDLLRLERPPLDPKNPPSLRELGFFAAHPRAEDAVDFILASHDLKVSKMAATPDKKRKDKPKRKAISKRMREMIWDHYIGRHQGESQCLCCRRNVISQLNFEVGHVVSVSRGGETVLDNLLPICGPCNKSMGSKSMSEFAEAHQFPSSTMHQPQPKPIDKVGAAVLPTMPQYAMPNEKQIKKVLDQQQREKAQREQAKPEPQTTLPPSPQPILLTFKQMNQLLRYHQ